MPVQLVHCADLHIGSSFSYLPSELAKIRKEELCRSFADIIDYCKEKAVDGLLICGDLFDTPVPSSADCAFVKSMFEKLSPVPAYVVCGNHDFLCSDSPFMKANFFPGNVHIFPGFDFSYEIPEKNTIIHGKSFSSNIVSPSFEELVIDSDKINVMCLHGDIVAGSDYNIISKETLEKTGCEYAAFGHIHNGELFTAGKVKCAYCGTAEAHKFNDDGKVGFIHAFISKEETHLMEIDHSIRHYHNIEFDISGLSEAEIPEKISDFLIDTDLYRIVLTGEKCENSDMNLNFLKEQLSGRVFHIDFTDAATVGYDFDSIEAEFSLRGEFLRELRKICSREEDFIISAKAGLDALSGRIPSLEVHYAD